MKILILGGTGAIGTDLVKLLTENGNEVYVTSRSDRISNDKHLVYIKGNAMEDTFLSEVLKLCEFDVIVDFMIYPTEAFKQRFDLLLKSTKQYMYFSSGRVYAESDVPITEKN